MDKKEKISDLEMQINSTLEKYKAEAVKNAIDAFNEGFLLGRQVARQTLGGKDGGR